jgi:pimeloyl-ACP methyl ester carboxylesterase
VSFAVLRRSGVTLQHPLAVKPAFTIRRRTRRLARRGTGDWGKLTGTTAEYANMNSPDLPKALDAERLEINGRAGRLSYYVSGTGPPMMLVHSINAAGSAREISPIFDAFRGSHRVFAPDLPGFGFSDRSRRRYDIALYVDALRDMLDVIEQDAADARIDALALSLSSEFLARLAVADPGPFRTLALVTPTGFRAGSQRLRGPEGSNREMRVLSSIVNAPFWRRGLYNALVRPGVIRYFLRRTWGSDDYDEGLAAYDDLTTHQPGAEHAPLAFLSGTLFAGDIRTIYEQIELPVWLPHGTRGDFRDFREAEWARKRDNWQVMAFDSGALPHFEMPDAFHAAYSAFLADVG